MVTKVKMTHTPNAFKKTQTKRKTNIHNLYKIIIITIIVIICDDCAGNESEENAICALELVLMRIDEQ